MAGREAAHFAAARPWPTPFANIGAAFLLLPLLKHNNRFFAGTPLLNAGILTLPLPLRWVRWRDNIAAPQLLAMLWCMA